MKFGEEIDELFPVPQQDVQYRLGFVWVSHKHLSETRKTIIFKVNLKKKEQGENIFGGVNTEVIEMKRADLENVECLELNISTGVDEHLHHQLEVVRVVDVQTHRREVVTIQ